MTRISRAHLRRSGFAVAALSLLLTLITLATVRPVAAADAWATYSMTYKGEAVGRSGGAGASGGLVAFSGGPGAVIGRLDAAPSGSAEASSIEPGTMARLVGGQINDASGDEVVGEPLTARAEFPGAAAEDEATQAGPQEAGPMTIVGATATAAVSASASSASAAVGRFRVAGDEAAAESLRQAATVWRTTWVDGDGGLAAAQQPREDTSAAILIEGAYGDALATADTSAKTLRNTIEVGADRVVLLGTVVLEGVVGRAVSGATDTERTASASLAIQSATVAGVPVTIGDTGVSVAENQVVNGADIGAANEQLNELLTNAGLTLRTVQTVEATDDRTARASSGGVAVQIVTASTSGIPRNVLVMTIGRGETTVSAEPAFTEPAITTGALPPASGTSDGFAAPPSSGSVDVSQPAPVEAPASPQVAEDPVSAPPQQVVAAGMTMSIQTAYAGFAAWMVFTFTLPLLGSLLLGRKP